MKTLLFHADSGKYGAGQVATFSDAAAKPLLSTNVKFPRKSGRHAYNGPVATEATPKEIEAWKKRTHQKPQKPDLMPVIFVRQVGNFPVGEPVHLSPKIAKKYLGGHEKEGRRYGPVAITPEEHAKAMEESELEAEERQKLRRKSALKILKAKAEAEKAAEVEKEKPTREPAKPPVKGVVKKAPVRK